MRLTTVILLATMLQVSASSFGQKVTFKQKGVTLLNVFKAIENQTGFSVIYYDKKVNIASVIDANFVNAPLEEVMNQILAGMPLTYTINKSNVVIKAKEVSIVDRIIDVFTNIDVRGKVVDENGLGLAGATVKVKGTTKSVLSNSEGEFFFANVDDKAVIVISYLGYESKEIGVSEKMGTISMSMSNGKLDEVEINAGYYKVSDRERTGSISRVTADQISKQPVSNVLQAMQANLPGVNITQNTGVPGGGFTVQIRGQNSIQQGNSPLYLVNGVPFPSASIGNSRSFNLIQNSSPLSSINPSDIESIEVLKDADATAIYGSRGANGVILITTKKGKPGQSIGTASISTGISQVAKRLELLDINQYIEMRKEAYFTNDLLTTSSPDYALQYDINGTWDQNKNTDWQRELIGGTAPSTNIETSLSGGSSNLQYLVGSSHYREGTVFPGEHIFQRSSFNMSLQYLSHNKKLSISFSSNYSLINSNLFESEITSNILLPPNYPNLLDANRNLNWENNTIFVNPIAQTRNPLNTKTKNLISNSSLSYQVLPGLQIKTNLGYTTMYKDEYSNTPIINISPAQAPTTLDRTAISLKNSIDTWIVEPQLNWKYNTSKGKLDVLAGTSFQQSITDNTTLRGVGFTTDALLNNIQAASTLNVSGRQYLQYRYTAIFGRLNYIWKERYILNATARRDGSSRFGRDNRFANFGAVGGAWIFSDENFIKPGSSFLSYGKLRGSYGITGNDQIPDYGYLELWGPNSTTSASYQGSSTIFPNQISNPNYAWEINKKIEAALDLGFFKNKIDLSLGFYNNKSNNLLVRTQLPPSTGFSTIQDNLPAEVRNNGWEFSLNSRNLATKNFSWLTSINLSVPENKLISYPGLKTSTDNQFYEIGYPLSISKLYNNTLDSQTGLYTIEDHDGNGLINNSDKYLIRERGKHFYGGVQNVINYKGIEFQFLIQFVKQTGRSYMYTLNYTPGEFSIYDPSNNQLSEVLDRWQTIGNENKFQKFSTLPIASTSYYNSRVGGKFELVDASFIRLKNVSLSYQLTKNLLRVLHMTVVKFYIQGQNIFTLTPYKGLDPETQSLSSLPPLRTIVAGIQFTF